MTGSKAIFTSSFLALCIWSLTFGPCELAAQSRNQCWIFGDSACIRFENDTVVSCQGSSINSLEASASISDDNGNLLFYSDGQTVWNSLHQVMENGTNLMIGSTYPGYGSSSTNGVTIIPKPGADSLFLILTTESLGASAGLTVSEVDIYANGSLGKVTNLKNVPVIQDSLAEKVHAVRHANGRDWWVVCRSISHGFNRFYVVLFTPQGWEQPIIHDIGPINVLTWNYYYAGEAEFSFHGDKFICITTPGLIDLYDFDRCTGSFSDYLPLGSLTQTNDGSFYGGSFSPSGRMLYVSNLDSLFQFDLTSPNVKQSGILVWEAPDAEVSVWQHELGPDKKIYISSGFDNPTNDTIDPKNKNLSVINNPDSLGLACNVSPYSVSIGQGRTIFGLPNNPNYALGPLVGSACDTLSVGIGNPVVPSLKVIPNPSSGKFRIEIPEAAVCERIRVIDVAGRKVWEQATPGIMKELEIDLGQLAEGTYYVELECLDGQVLRSKIMIQR